MGGKLEVRIVETKGGDVVKDIVASCNKSDYEVLYRFWVRSDGIAIREWTPHEYIMQNPKKKIVLSTRIDGSMINVEAHCVECRNIYAHKNGRRVTSFINIIDYSKERL